MNLQSILDTTAKRFDDEFGNQNLRDNKSEQKVERYIKSFIHAEQLAVLEAVRKEIKGKKNEFELLAYTSADPGEEREATHIAFRVYEVLSDLLSALDLKEQV